MRTIRITAGAWALWLASGAAVAQPITLLRFEARLFDSTHNDGWAASVNAQPGDRIEVRAVVSLASGTTLGGLKQIVFQPVITGGVNWEGVGGDNLLTNADLGLPGPAEGIGPTGGNRSTPRGIIEDLPNGTYGRMSPWGANATTTSTYLRGHLGTGTAAGLLRIAQANITNWVGVGATSGATANNNINGGGGVSIAQISFASRLSTDPLFEPRQTNLVVFKFGLVLGASTNARTLDIDTPPAGVGRILQGALYVDNVQWFNSPNSGDVDFSRGGLSVEAAHIAVIPGPGAAVLAGFGALFVARRRR